MATQAIQPKRKETRTVNGLEIEVECFRWLKHREADRLADGHRGGLSAILNEMVRAEMERDAAESEEGGAR